jgi:hypothetical protein
MRIFIQMASYQHNAVESMRDCIANASNKENLTFGVCLQQNEEIPVELKHERIKISRVPLSESQGPGWALKKAQDFYDGQEYTMLIDSRTRFAKDWDKELINALESLDNHKSIITNCPPKFDPKNGTKDESMAYRPIVYQLIKTPLIWPMNMKGVNSIIPNHWISSLFFFTRGSHCLDCPYDPNMYYSEIESNIVLRSYTAGYDIFSLNKPVVWKDYNQNVMNWMNDPMWTLKDLNSKSRIEELIRGQIEDYPLGKIRTIKDFEIFSGIDFVNKRVNKSSASGGKFKFENESQWEKEFHKDYSLVASWNVDEIEKCEDYDYWYFSIEDKNEGILFRSDLRPDRDGNIMSFKTNFKKVTFRTASKEKPYKVCIWPVSKSKGWLKKSKFEL